MIKKIGERKISFSGWSNGRSGSNDFREMYGSDACECISSNDQYTFVFSQVRTLDLIELEQLLQSVGWSRRPIRRVKKALDNSLLKVGVWQHDPKFPRLIGFARCTGDEVIQATIWDVAIHPVYQGFGLGKELMSYVLRSLKDKGIERVVLFADPGVISFYQSQGWTLEPKGNRCAFWYAN
ncbi:MULTISPECIES: GNAT family N-acetyltransferase [Prochlorococcus]|uniref:Uncharacterized N-acetyltransferase ycf52-like n=1 Tax=Prochlorococcus marinus (strain SARG / CCMP1375 / SS120) TaxID=167539 RepID=YC52L_PROMA|nr:MULTISPECIES: GNAT family N-acetyltransferase [Prochlorococcus]Q51893.1 RecName: Full=Uncharacterized N-acetyltransferase ycf52-like [Prochlorococcus marinus subsp. marinus str. CCMP1375]AAC15819.1 unknown [Prochlorococcus marinus]AAP99609.1 Acetyltransferase, GNAT family [Prochlorococcus marinus subsp. marinus str. CCMP1375]KGG11121.1 N-acetyltransferase (GNAT) family [Prochlorococcus marinus str. LG]KGG21459.1 N-acetyltransferase (GNAT) family [Prochlorococcus marinus str. SS2]KGG23196.1